MEDFPQSESNLSIVATELLLSRFKKGDSRAMNKLFFRVRDNLRAAVRDHPCYHFLSTTQEEEDVIQDLWTMLLARGSLGRFKSQGPGSLRAWLRRALDCLMIDISRKVGADKRGGDRPPEPLDSGGSSDGGQVPPAAAGPGPGTVAEWGDWQERCLRLLTGQDREVWRLRFVEDLAYATIAQNLGITENAVRSAYRRAIAKLHESGILRVE